MRLRMGAIALVLGSAGLAQPLVARPPKASPAAQVQILPQVRGPIPNTAASWPYLNAKATMQAADYVEEEYFLSGTANVYDWDGPDGRVKVIAGPGHYVNRILVRRPRDADKFSGNVEVTILNASLGVDLGGPTDLERMIAQGDVWIGITSKPLAVNALKRFDPARYASLDWSSPVPASARCPYPSIIPAYMIGSDDLIEQMAKAGFAGSSPETEDGLVWDMLGQLGQLLKSGRRGAILPGFGKPRIFMTGVSQSAIYIRTWLKGFQDRYRTADGKPVYDGYLAVVGPAQVRINQCAKDIPLDDPRQKLSTPDVPFISISSEGEMWQARYTHQADAFTAHGGMVTYEVAGASHRAFDVPGLPADTITMGSMQDLMKAGVKMPDMAGAAKMMPAGTLPNDFVWQPLVRGAWHNLEDWVRDGKRPPQAPGILLDPAHEIRRDAQGNAVGGLRAPGITVPVASHRGYLSPGGLGGVMGVKRPFTLAELTKLYPDHVTYVAKVSAAADAMGAQGWISAEDAAATKKAAETAQIPR